MCGRGSFRLDAGGLDDFGPLVGFGGDEFFKIAPRVPVRTQTETFALEQANTALDLFRAGKLSATAVLTIAK